MTHSTLPRHDGAALAIVVRVFLAVLVIGTLLALAYAVSQGREGWIGAGLAIAIGSVFFAVDALLLLPALRESHPYLTVGLGLSLYSLKAFGLLVFMVSFWTAKWFDAAAFGWVLLVVTLWWQVRLISAHRRARIVLYELSEAV